MPQKRVEVPGEQPPLKRTRKSLKQNDDDEVQQSASTPTASQLPLGPPPTELFSLYVRGPKWIKDREESVIKLKEVNSKITNVRHPRQKSTDYCFIDFASASDRDQAYEELKSNNELHVKPRVKDVPKWLKKRVKKVTEKREAKNESKKILREITKRETHKGITNQVMIVNLPRETTKIELKNQFADVVDINMKMAKKGKKLNSAVLTFSMPQEAVKASRETIHLHGAKLNILLNTTFRKLNIQKKNVGDVKKDGDNKSAIKQTKMEKSKTPRNKKRKSLKIIKTVDK